MIKESWHRNSKVASLLIVCVVLAITGLQNSIAAALNSQRTISSYGEIQVVHTSEMIVGTDMWSGTAASKFLSESYLSHMQECGIQMVRLEFNRDSVANLRTLVPVVVQNGIQVLGLLLRTDLAPDNEDAWGDWVYSLVNEFKQYVKVWEIWNEPNLENYFPGKDPVKYTNFLKRGYTEAKQADPTCIVMGGSICGCQDSSVDYLRSMYNNGARDYMDAVAIHPYCGPNPPEYPHANSWPSGFWMLQKYRDLMVERGDGSKKIWITEMGWPTSGTNPVSEEEQAQYLTTALTMALDWGWVETFIIYNWQDGGDFGYGLLRADLSPKPSFYAVKSFTTSS